MKYSKTLLAVLTALTASAGSHSLHAQSILPTCQSASADPDGDGYGWENSASCRVADDESSADPITNNSSSTDGAVFFCQSAASDPDGDGFGWENSRSCVVAVDSGDLLPGGPTFNSYCTSADSDPDGDGYGWENNATCEVQGSEVAEAGYPTITICEFSASDPDGDGFGWENNQSCTVSTDLGTDDDGTGSGFIPMDICIFSSSDPDGDGFGWEDNASCVVDSTSVDDGGYPPGEEPTDEEQTAEQPIGEEPPTETADFSAISPSGLLSDGTPTFRWNALDNAEMYTLAVADSLGNGYAYEITPAGAGCQDGGVCAVTPDLAYYDNDLTWRVKTIVNGAQGPETSRIAITTPQNTNIQPVKSGECEAWPSVAYDKYVVLNNSWNSRAMNNPAWQQKIFVNEDQYGNVVPSWTYDWLGQYDGGEIDVKAYPEVLYGPKLGTHVSGSKAETGLPELVSDLPEFVVDYAYTETGNAERNVALESFFHDSCNIAGPCDEVDNRAYEMMIWVENPSIRTPGQLALTDVLIDNRYWKVYIKPNSNKHYIAFTAQDSQSSGTINWNRFVEWTQNWTEQNATALGIDVLKPEFCMGAIELGTEMWWGAGSFTLNQFDVSFTQ